MSVGGVEPAAVLRAPFPGWQPCIIALVCHWCTYAGADMAGTTRISHPATVRIVRFPCTGRINPAHVVKAFEQGADGVLVSGCHPADCHYVHGNLVARRRFVALRSLLDFVGVDARRLHFAWVSAAEGRKWADLVTEVTAAVRQAGPLPGWGSEPPPPPSGPVRLAPLAHAEPRSCASGERDAVVGHLRGLVAELVGRGDLPVVVAYARAQRSGRTVPCLVTRPGQAAHLTWGEHCLPNLAAHLGSALTRASKVGLVVKGCDARAVLRLVREGQVRREDVVLISPPCRGVAADGGLAAKCHSCPGGHAPGCDYGVSAEGVRPGEVCGVGEREVGPDPRDAQIAQLEALTAEERWHFWRRQFARCLRCYACRAVCPGCYCTVCVARRHRPQWIPTAIDGRGNTVWNVVRALHAAGRCVGCDDCARVCPANIRLDLLHRKVSLEMEQRFGGEVGEDGLVAPPLAEFRMDDPAEFFR